MASHETFSHESSDANIQPIIITGVGLAISAALVALVVYGIFHYLSTQPVSTAPPNPMSATEPQIPPPPRIEEHPMIELQQLRQQEDSVLSTYGWADKSAGAVRIPIDRAMELELQRNFAPPKVGKK